MRDQSANMSIDFLVGCTIFILAFIWVASMIPGMLIDLQSNTVDFDAVAYRTGVILIEDPGYPASPPWELFPGGMKENVTRFGLSITKERPNILSEEKVNRFTCTTSYHPTLGFEYPDEYHTKAIFGEYPYHFNISLRDVPMGETRVIGEIRPDGYGYIRRLAKIKGMSNASLDCDLTDPYGTKYIDTFRYRYTGVGDSTTVHRFSFLFNNSYLLQTIKDPAYQIDPSREEVRVSIYNINKSMNAIDSHLIQVNLQNISVFTLEGGKMNYKRTFSEPIIDGTYYRDLNSSFNIIPPVEKSNNITLIFPPGFSSEILKGADYPIYVNLTFNLTAPSSFLNNTRSKPFDYNYNPKNVTQPQLRDAIIEVAVW
jgi:hypothetical protein